MRVFVPPACFVLCLAAVLGVPGSPAALAEDGADQPATGHRFAVDRWTAKEQKIIDALNQPLKEPLSFDERPLSLIIAVIADTHQLKILPDQASLEAAGINSLDELTVSIELADVTLRSALNLMLEPRELAYVIEDEVMQIMWQEDADDHLTTVVYDVRPLIEAGYTEGSLILPIQNETTGPWFPDDPNKRIDAVIGGLSIRHTRPVHDEVEAILQGLLKLTQRHARPAPRDVQGNETVPEPEKAAQPAAQDGISAHPVERGNAYPGSVNYAIRPQWRVVIYDVTALTEAGYEVERLSQVVRAVVQPEDWNVKTLIHSHGGRLPSGGVYPSAGFFSVPSIADPKKTSGNETFKQFGLSHSHSPMKSVSQEIELHGRIEPLGNTLVVYHSPSVHEAIKSFLQELDQVHRDERENNEQR